MTFRIHVFLVSRLAVVEKEADKILLRGLPFMTSALRGEGVPSKADIVGNLSKGGCVNLRTGGEGSKNPKILRTS